MIMNFLLAFVNCVSLKRGGENPLFRILVQLLVGQDRQIFPGALLRLSSEPLFLRGSQQEVRQENCDTYSLTPSMLMCQKSAAVLEFF